MRDNISYLRDIYDAMRSIENFVDDMRFDEFEGDDKTLSAVIRKFEIISEASKNIPEGIKKRYQDIPWGEMEVTRDKLLHTYYAINYNLIRHIIKNRIPPIKRSLFEILKNT